MTKSLKKETTVFYHQLVAEELEQIEFTKLWIRNGFEGIGLYFYILNKITGRAFLDKEDFSLLVEQKGASNELLEKVLENVDDLYVEIIKGREVIASHRNDEHNETIKGFAINGKKGGVMKEINRCLTEGKIERCKELLNEYYDSIIPEEVANRTINYIRENQTLKGFDINNCLNTYSGMEFRRT